MGVWKIKENKGENKGDASLFLRKGKRPLYGALYGADDAGGEGGNSETGEPEGHGPHKPHPRG